MVTTLEIRLLEWWDGLLDGLVADGVLTADEASVAELQISDDPALRGSPRNFAATMTNLLGPWGPVEIHRAAFRLPRQKLVAIALHELGHVLHGTHRFDSDDAPEDGENRADWLVEHVLGVRLRYDPRDMVQTLDAHGVKRAPGFR